MTTYKVNINKNANGSTEIKSFNNLKVAFDYFSKLDVNDLEDTNGESDEYELAKYEDGEFQEWKNEELREIGWAENSWVIKSKISQ